MQIPLQISFENTEPSEAIRTAIEHEVARLEKYRHHITGCRVAVVAPSTKHRHGAVYRINIRVTVPPHENIVVSYQPSDDQSNVHVEVAIKHAFAARDAKSRFWINARAAMSSSTRSNLMGEFRRFLRLRLHRDTGRTRDLLPSEQRDR